MNSCHKLLYQKSQIFWKSIFSASVGKSLTRRFRCDHETVLALTKIDLLPLSFDGKISKWFCRFFFRSVFFIELFVLNSILCCSKGKKKTPFDYTYSATSYRFLRTPNQRNRAGGERIIVYSILDYMDFFRWKFVYYFGAFYFVWIFLWFNMCAFALCKRYPDLKWYIQETSKQ